MLLCFSFRFRPDRWGLQDCFHLFLGVGFNNVAFLKVVEPVHPDAAFIPRLHLFDVVFEALEGIDLAAFEHRLAGQQRSLKEMADQIAKDLKGERPLGRMDKVIEQMEEVIRDLEGGTLDEGTVRNEERIVSRLLDANRSVHTRDYEKKRTSETAQDIFSESIGVDPSKPMSQLLREEIRRAMSLKAPGEFEDLIKLYFRALAEEAQQTDQDK